MDRSKAKVVCGLTLTSGKCCCAGLVLCEVMRGNFHCINITHNFKYKVL